MDILNIRAELKMKPIYDIPMRVTFYARVSSEKDEQLNSLDNQISYYTDLIKNNTTWTYVDGYIDEGLSGMSTLKRENFHRMINDAEQKKFDLIITKEISRFARNTLDSIKYTRDLLSYGVGVFFQNDNINTLDEDSELRLTIMSGIAQDELRKLSSRVKFGHQQAIKNNVVLGNSRMFGYKKHNKRLVIDESQREMVEELFEMYSSGKYSLKQIENIFWEKGYRNYNGKKIAHTTMSNMLSNPKYKGYYVGNKVRIVDMFTKEQKFLPPEEWVMFKDESGEIVPAIVSEEVWNKANEILKSRSLDVKKRQNKCNHNNILTGKLYCSHCGLPYYRKDSKNRDGTSCSKWICSGKIKNGYDSCPSFTLYESEIKEVLFTFFQMNNSDIPKLIDKYVEIYQSLNLDKALNKKILETKDKIDLVLRKQNKLLEYSTIGQIKDSDFLRMNSQCSTELENLTIELSSLEERLTESNSVSEKIIKLKSVLKEAIEQAKDGIITRDFVEQFIDIIYVEPDNILNNEKIKKAILKVRLKNGDMTPFSLEHTVGSTGHTFKKMIPVLPTKKEVHYIRNNRTVNEHIMDIEYSVFMVI